MPRDRSYQPGFVVESLTRDQIGPSFVILRLMHPWIEQRCWQNFAQRSLTANPDHRGIITIRRDGGRFPSGLACYRRESDAEIGRLLTVHPMAAVDMVDATPQLVRLTTGLVQIARRTGCGALRLVVAEAGAAYTSFNRMEFNQMGQVGQVEQLGPVAATGHEYTLFLK
ncbi:MAG: hypothetical protein PHT60_05380 [Acidiphilium sp.]|nr:hypothetical protein [Acidiphilium sp.]MDD4935194.1 hypothetical protein [Acidiphilium sp.]